MGRYVNPGDHYYAVVANSGIYVDKTGMPGRPQKEHHPRIMGYVLLHGYTPKKECLSEA